MRLNIRLLVASLIWVQLCGAVPAFAVQPNDPLLEEQWYLEQIHAFEAWEVSTGTREVIVAVLDTGVDPDHPDLVEQLWKNIDEVPDDGIDNDRNGYVDDVTGWDFIEDDNSPFPTPSDSFDASAVSHGTLIAGIIGAVGNNTEGIAGINWQVTIMPLRILDDTGSGNSFAARRAVAYAMDNGADVINLSFTGFDLDESFRSNIKTASELGVTVVAAVGNDNSGGINLNETPIYPACFFSDEGDDLVIGVASSDLEDERASFSNYGSICTDISAPGIGLYGTTFQDDDLSDFEPFYDGYWSGTSASAPMVAAGAALLKGRYPSLRPEEIRIILQLSVDPMQEQGTDAEGQVGAGRLNLARALEIGASFAPVGVPAGGAPRASSGSLVAAEAIGAPPLVRRLTSAGTVLNEFLAYDPAFTGGVRLAMGDVDGDGVDEIVTAPGPGGGPEVRVFETDGTLIEQFFAYGEATRFGVFVATGDLDGNGVDEILTTPDAGGEGELRVFTAAGEQEQFFFPFDRTAMSVRVAAGDLDGDGKDEIVAGLGGGGKPRVRVFEHDGSFLSEFDAYASTYDRGIFVGAGDLDGDGVSEIVTGTDAGGGPHVRAFDADGTVRASFFAYDERFRGGVRIAVGDLDSNGISEVYTAAGPGGGPHARVFDGSGRNVGGFFAFDELARDGINLGAW